MKKAVALLLALVMLASLCSNVFADSAIMQEGSALYAESGEVPAADLYAAIQSFYEGVDFAALAGKEVEKSLKLGYLDSNRSFSTVIEEPGVHYYLDEEEITGSEESPIGLEPGEHSAGVSFEYTTEYSYSRLFAKKSGSKSGTYEDSKSFTFEIRQATEIHLEADKVSYVWGEEVTKEELLAQLSPTVILPGDGGKPLEDAKVEILEDFSKFNAGEYTLTLNYEGKPGEGENLGYMPATAQAKLTVKKAATAVEVVSSTVTYDAKEHFITVNVTPADVPYTAFTVGLQGDASGFASLYMSEGNALYKTLTSLQKVGDAAIYIARIFGIDLTNFIIGSDGVSLDQLRNLLEHITELSEYLSDSSILPGGSEISGILQILSAIEKIMPDLNVRFYLAGMPKNEGLYITYATASDENHETAIDFGYTTVAPNLNVSLEWRQNEEGYSFNRQNVGKFDYSAFLKDRESGETIDSPITYKFTGVTSAGKIFSGNGLEEAPTVPGVYTETAYSLYNYVATESRIITVNRDSVSVQFVDGEGNPVDKETVEYNGEGQSIKAVVKDKDGKEIEEAKVSYSYSGKTKAGKTYLSTQAPVNSGSYTVRASFAGDGFYNPASNTASLEITKKDASITFDNVTIKVFKGVDVSSVKYTYTGMTAEEAARIAATLKSPYKTYILIGSYKMSVSIPADISESYDVKVNGGKITVKLFG